MKNLYFDISLFIKMKRIVCENIRSAYNVWNIIRTADALGWWVVTCWYTPWFDNPKIIKTSLGAEQKIPKKTIDNIEELFIFVEQRDSIIICAEKNPNSIKLENISQTIYNIKKWNENLNDIYVIVGNEVSWVEDISLQKCDIVCEIEMLGQKESLNVWQAAAIFMREINKFIK